MKRILIFLLAAVFLITGWSKNNWTIEEKNNIEHFISSGEYSMSAVRIINLGKAYQRIPISETNEINRLMLLSLKEAKLVRDDVLRKAHPILPEKFRSLYQKSLELRIESLHEKNNKKSIQSSNLHDLWVDWYNLNKKKIKIPK